MNCILKLIYSSLISSCKAFFANNKKWIFCIQLVFFSFISQSVFAQLPIENSFFIGGSGNESQFEMTEHNGKIYFVGMTTSADVPVTDGSTLNDSSDLLVGCYNIATKTYDWLRYVGGDGFELYNNNKGLLIVGNSMYFNAVSQSSTFEMQTNTKSVIGAFSQHINISIDITTATVNWSTWLGSIEAANFIYSKTIISDGVLYTITATDHDDWSPTTGPAFTGVKDIAVAAINTIDGSVVWKRYFGGSNWDTIRFQGGGIEVLNGVLVFNGWTFSADFPFTDGSTYQGSGQQPYIAAFNTTNGSVAYVNRAHYTGSAARYNSLFTDGTDVFVIGNNAFTSDLYITSWNATTGVENYHKVYENTVSREGTSKVIAKGANAYLVTNTSDANFPTTDGSTHSVETYDIAVAKIDLINGNFIWSKFIGPQGVNGVGTNEVIFDNTTNQLVVSGLIFSTNWPSTDGTTVNGSNAIHHTIINPATGASCFSTLVGGSVNEISSNQFVNSNSFSNFSNFISNGILYTMSGTQSADYPVTDPTSSLLGSVDMVITGIDIGGQPAIRFAIDNSVSPDQFTCLGGNTTLIDASPIELPESNLPLIYRAGVEEVQSSFEAVYQWQSSDSPTGPWLDISGAILEDYLPETVVTDKYYRRISLNAPVLCNGQIITTSNVHAVLINTDVAAKADAGGIFYTCIGSPITIGGLPSATGGTPPYTYSWDYNTLETNSNPTVSPSVATVYGLTVTDANGCSTTDYAIVNVITADAGEDICASDGKAVQIGGTPSAGFENVIYSWFPTTGLSDPNILNPTATIPVGTSQTYTLSVTIPTGVGTCTTTDDVVVNSVESPGGIQDFAGPDITVCYGEDITIGMPAVAGYTYIYTPGNYLTNVFGDEGIKTFNTGTLTYPSSINPITYTILATSAGGCYFTDTVTVNVIATKAGKDTCGPTTIGYENTDSPFLNEAFLWTVVSGTGTIIGPANGATAAVSGSDTASVYRLTTTLNGVSCYDEVTVGSCFPSGTVTCSVDIEVVSEGGCAEENSIIKASHTANADDYTYSWEDLDTGLQQGLSSYNTQEVTIINANERSYKLTMTNIADPSIICTATILTNSPSFLAPTFTAQDHTTCSGQIVNLGENTVVGYSYSWSPTDGLNDATIANPELTTDVSKIYTVTVTDVVTGCSTIVESNITIIDVTADAGEDWTICNSALVKLGTPAKPGYQYLWSPVVSNYQNGTDETSAQPEFITVGPLTFTVTVIDTNTGCSTSDSVDIINNNTPVLTPASDVFYCLGSAGEIIGEPAEPGVTYSWLPTVGLSDPNIAQPIASPNNTTLYTLTATFSGGCLAFDDVMVTAFDPVFTMANIDYCPSDGALELGGDAPTVGVQSYSWSPNNLLSQWWTQTPDTFDPPPSIETDFTLTVQYVNGCSYTNTVTITPNFVGPDAGNNGNICLNETLQLGEPADANSTYSWLPTTGLDHANIANPIFTPSSSGSVTYTVTKTNAANTCSSTDEVTIIVTDLDLPAMSPPTICMNGSTIIGVPNQIGVTYAWSPSIGLDDPSVSMPVASPTISTLYTLTAISAGGCVAIERVLVSVQTSPAPTITMGNKITYVGASTITFDPKIAPAIGVYTYVWSPNNGTISDINIKNPMITVGSAGEYEYSLTVFDAKGCSSIKMVKLIVNAENITEATNDINNTYLDVAVNGNVLTNDFDPEGAIQMVTTTSVTSTQGVLITIDAVTGDYIYTPPSGFVGTDTFEYTVCNNSNPEACATATVTIEVVDYLVNTTNNPPVANNDTATTEVDVAVNGKITANDFDPDWDTIIVTTTPVSDPNNGTVIINADGSYTYTPNPGFKGLDRFTYQICDNGTPSLCDTAEVVIDIKDNDGGINDTYAHDDAYNADKNSTIEANVLNNDYDPELDLQLVNTTPVQQPVNGTLVLNGNGTFVYKPNTDFVGTDNFIYSLCDAGLPQVCDIATVYLTVNSNNTTKATNDINNSYVDVAVSGNVLTNDNDQEGDLQTITTTSVTTTEGVIITIDALTGDYMYTPPTGFVGTDTFQYTVCDDAIPQACSTATVSIEVIEYLEITNNAPIANNDTATTEVDVAVNGKIVPNDFDPDKDPISITTTPVSIPTNGTVVINPDGTYSYTPNPGYIGEDRFTYQICDNGSPSLCDTAEVVIHIKDNNGINDTYAHDDAYNTNKNIAIEANVLSNDNDPEIDEQLVNIMPIQGPLNGTIILNADGSFIYTPNSDFVGTDSFVYSLCDDGTPQVCDQATVYLTVNASNKTIATNDINNTYLEVAVSGNVFTNDFDPEGDLQTITTTSVTTTEGVVVTIDAETGEYIYTPPTGFIGTDSFKYSVCDDANPQACATAIVTIEVLSLLGTSINSPPIANNDTATTEVDVAVNGKIIPNDFDPDKDSISITTTPISNPTNGTVIINADGSYRYTPNAGFKGEDSFTYQICDDRTPSLCDSAEVVITIKENNGVNDTYAHDDAYNTYKNIPIEANVLSNDNDPEIDLQLVNTTPVQIPLNGTLVLNADGSFMYTPDIDFEGTDSFIYSLCDAGTPQVCDQATVYITVTIKGIDSDGDGVLDTKEEEDGTDPNNPCQFIATSITLEQSDGYLNSDCDGDLILNGQEISDGTNPNDPCSSIGGTPPPGSNCDIFIEMDLIDTKTANGFFNIVNINAFPDNTVKIYNRWGVLVFETKGYNNADNSFHGKSNGRATIKVDDNLPAGVYYYIIEYVKQGGFKSKTGYIYVTK